MPNRILFESPDGQNHTLWKYTLTNSGRWSIRSYRLYKHKNVRGDRPVARSGLGGDGVGNAFPAKVNFFAYFWEKVDFFARIFGKSGPFRKLFLEKVDSFACSLHVVGMLPEKILEIMHLATLWSNYIPFQIVTNKTCRKLWTILNTLGP